MTPDQEDTITYAFSEFIDVTIDRLVEAGLTEEQALDTVFLSATTLAEADIIPEFPDDEAPIVDRAHWLLQASEFGFINFCVEALESGG